MQSSNFAHQTQNSAARTWTWINMTYLMEQGESRNLAIVTIQSMDIEGDGKVQFHLGNKGKICLSQWSYKRSTHFLIIIFKSFLRICIVRGIVFFLDMSILMTVHYLCPYSNGETFTKVAYNVEHFNKLRKDFCRLCCYCFEVPFKYPWLEINQIKY